MQEDSLLLKNINGPAHNKTYYEICVTSEDLDQPVHPHSLIRVFADHICLLQPPGYPKRVQRETLPYWVDVQVRFLLVTQVLL